MDLGLRGKVALVAAASKGLGRAVAEELASEGATLVICARGEAELRAARDAIADRAKVEVEAVAADLSTMEGIQRVAHAALSRHGRVDVLVNNAGGPPSGPFESFPWDAWQNAVNLTLRSTIE